VTEMDDGKKDAPEKEKGSKKERTGGDYVEYTVFSAMVAIVLITILVHMLGISKIGETPIHDKIVLGVTTILFLFAPRLIFAKIRFKLPAMILLFIEVFVFLGMYLGEIQYAFYTFHWWDIFLHFLSGVLLAMLAFLVIYPLYMQKPAKAYAYIVLLFSLFFAIGAGGIWELIEYSIDVIFGTNMQRSGLPDTMGDIAIDTAGALIASMTAYLYIIKKRHSRVIEDIVKDYYENNRRLFEVEVDEDR